MPKYSIDFEIRRAYRAEVEAEDETDARYKIYEDMSILSDSYQIDYEILIGDIEEIE